MNEMKDKDVMKDEMKDKDEIKKEILKELNKETRLLILKGVDYDFGSLEEISTIDLPFLCIPFLNGRVFDRRGDKEEAENSFKEFNFLIEKSGIVGRDLVRACSHPSRENKILLYSITRAFSFSFIDWEDREWLVRLLEFFYIKSSETLNYLKQEMSFLLKKDGIKKDGIKKDGIKKDGIKKDGIKKDGIKKDGIKKDGIKMEVYHLGNSKSDLYKEGIVLPDQISSKSFYALPLVPSYALPSGSSPVYARKDLLKRRINPKYSLEEFGDVLVERIKELEKLPQVQRKDPEPVDLSTLRKEDEERDERHVQKGNTKNVG